MILDLSPETGGAVDNFMLLRGDQAVPVFRPTTAAGSAAGVTARACFPLVPYSNRIAGGRLEAGNCTIWLPANSALSNYPIHGHGWLAPWLIKHHDGQTAVLEHAHDGRDGWPFAYRAGQRFELTELALRVTLSLENCSPKTMPAGLGLHPYFERTPLCSVRAGVSNVWLADEAAVPLERVAVPAQWDIAAGRAIDSLVLDHCFGGWNGQARIDWPERRLQLSIATEPALDHLVVYVPPARDFFCVEPVSHANNAFQLAARAVPEVGAATMEPGQAMSVAITFTVVE